MLEGAASLGVLLSGLQIETFLRYLELLRRWNRRARLTSLADGSDVVHLHFLDSLAVLSAEIPLHARLVDVGSGAGFPGVPLAIARPDLQIFLLEPAARKAAFLEIAGGELGLALSVRQDRAEDAGRDPAWREQFALATARALARAPVVAELLLPLVTVGGKAVILKGPSGDTEAAALDRAVRVLGGDSPEAVRITLPRGERRVLFTIAKVAPTPDQYPRRPGIPRRRPISR